jgi:hypothetical protein
MLLVAVQVVLALLVINRESRRNSDFTILVSLGEYATRAGGTYI